jgi:hypothetical protein
MCRQLNESKRLKPLRSRSICRFEHIAANGSGKVVAKSARENEIQCATTFRKNYEHEAELLASTKAFSNSIEIMPNRVVIFME